MKVSSTFSKVAGCRGSAPARAPQSAELSLCFIKRRMGSKGEPSPGVPPFLYVSACAPIRWEVVVSLSCHSTPFLWCLPKETVSSRQRKALFLPRWLHHSRERCCLGCLYSSSPDLGQGLGGYLGNKKRRPVGGVFFFIYMAYFFISGLTVSGSAVMVMVNLMPSLSAKLESQSRKSRTCASVPALNILWKLSMKMWEMS